MISYSEQPHNKNTGIQQTDNLETETEDIFFKLYTENFQKGYDSYLYPMTCIIFQKASISYTEHYTVALKFMELLENFRLFHSGNRDSFYIKMYETEMTPAKIRKMIGDFINVKNSIMSADKETYQKIKLLEKELPMVENNDMISSNRTLIADVPYKEYNKNVHIMGTDENKAARYVQQGAIAINALVNELKSKSEDPKIADIVKEVNEYNGGLIMFFSEGQQNVANRIKELNKLQNENDELRARNALLELETEELANEWNTVKRTNERLKNIVCPES